MISMYHIVLLNVLFNFLMHFKHFILFYFLHFKLLITKTCTLQKVLRQVSVFRKGYSLFYLILKQNSWKCCFEI